jgi:gluconolactonase
VTPPRSPAALAAAVLAAAAAVFAAAPTRESGTFGKIDRKDPRFDKIVPPGAVVENLAAGFDWSEGPVWVKSGGYLLFSDIPKNTVWKWTADAGTELFLKPSGYSGTTPFTGKEPGSNGLAVDAKGRLLLCQHGDRRVAALDLATKKLTVLADMYQGKRFNSPNDLTIKSNGDIYFTDPPYGLPKIADDPARELDFCGVYRLSPDGTVTLLTKEMTRPNGIAFSPDEKTLYVANSDPALAIWKAFPVKEDGTLGEGKVFSDATEWVKEKKPGLPDGLKVDKAGNVFATGPGGVHVFAPDGTLLGTLNTGVPTANVGWGDDGSVLYVTADKNLVRVKTTTKGLGF